MLGATLRVKSRLADPCRGNTCVSKLVLDTKGSFIDGCVMLEPARKGLSLIGSNIRHPPLTRWVWYPTGVETPNVGNNITDPPLTRWV